MHRPVFVIALALAACLCGGAAVAQPAPAVLGAAARACTSAATPVSVAGPWRRGDTAYTAAVFWREGATRACLALVAQRPGAVTVLARGSVTSGWSERYSERYAPSLRAEAIWLPGLPPLPMLETMQMGAGGGGGHLTTLLRASRGRWEQVFAQTLDGVTDINAEVDTPCMGRAPIVQDGAVLRVTECFDGRSTERAVRYDGRLFVPAP